ncbi:PaaI family thioesterase [Hydrogenophaga sp. PAMC20947]|uniref:PaaI family thioesterase n=1 Tax=Hydrogenophaga sp. PAMC20947 TaxID=2565558 RepID=UPI00109E06D8|nr:PaaI family thioesterase [Hydrogenophaga sp. PAMC20947]QCB47529.1 PaaI family thioesterase [Hydrogenophaga sp. PAMC20947]
MGEPVSAIFAATTTTTTTATLEQALREWFAPWVQALELRVEGFEDGAVTLRLPMNPTLSRIGGLVCGQALMAAADTAMVLAIVTRLGNQRPMTTVQLNTSFLKPLANQDALVTARVIRAGKNLVFGEIDIVAATDGKSVCRASTTYALL